MNRILLGICSYDARIDIELVPFLMRAAIDADVVFSGITHRPTDVARNMFVNQAQRSGRNLVMVDADSIPSPSSFKILVDKISSEECVAGIPYCASGGQICVGEKSPTVKQMEGYVGWTEVDNIGTHTIGYNIRVFDRIEKPYFEYEYNLDRTALRGYAEDTVLHRKLYKAGVKIYCCWDEWSGHKCTKIYDRPRSLTEYEKQLFLMAQ